MCHDNWVIETHVVRNVAFNRGIAGIGEEKLPRSLELDMLFRHIAKNVGSIAGVAGLHLWIRVETLRCSPPTGERSREAVICRVVQPLRVNGNPLVR